MLAATADSNLLSFSMINSFAVTVSPWTNPVADLVTVSGEQINPAASGSQGPGNTLETAASLPGGRQALSTAGFKDSPVTQVTDCNPTGSRRFDRVPIGP